MKKKQLASLIPILPFLFIFTFIFFDIYSHRSIEDNRAATVLITGKLGNGTAEGSGVVLKDGTILTANHVIDGLSNVTIAFVDDIDKKYEAKIVKASKDPDLAILSIDKKREEYVTVDCVYPKLGEDVYSIGQSARNYWSIFYGKVSVVNYPTFKENEEKSFNYAINIGSLEGSSGGGVFSERTGYLIGINKAIFATLLTYDIRTGEDIYIPYQVSYPTTPEEICNFLEK